MIRAALWAAQGLAQAVIVGGSTKDGVIGIQGDHCDALVADLIERSYTVKRAGG